MLQFSFFLRVIVHVLMVQMALSDPKYVPKLGFAGTNFFMVRPPMDLF